MQRVCTIVAILSLWTGVRVTLGADDANSPRWWKGNLHTHTLWSDGDDFPDMASLWYKEHDYQFLAISDHNVLQHGDVWKRIATMKGGHVAFDKYLKRLGATWVESRGQSENGGPIEVRLKPIQEYRTLVEEPGKFLIIQAEEISDKVDGVPLHLNAHNLLEVIKPQGGATIQEAMTADLRVAEEQASRTGQEMFVHLNHPNFKWAVTAEDMAAVVAEKFFEVYNGHPIAFNMGDDTHQSVERLWDIANTIRLEKLKAAPLYGLASDDTHEYHNPGMARSTPGRGWIMVRAVHLTPESLIRAIKTGDFYATDGVLLSDVRFDADAKTLSVDIAPDGDATFTTAFLGSLEGVDLAATPMKAKGADGVDRQTTGKYADAVGQVLATIEGAHASYTLKGNELYVRAVVTSSKAPSEPSRENQKAQAWTQPVGWQARVAPATNHARQ